MDEVRKHIVTDAQAHIRKMFYGYPWKIAPIQKYRIEPKLPNATVKTETPQE